jgi:hypothetical protein
MGFFAKIKQMLGIGTVSVKLNVPGSISASEGKIAGSVTITGKSAQKIKSIEIKMEEEVTTGRGDDKKSKTYTIGTWSDTKEFDIAEGEVKVVNFEMNVAVHKSSTDEMAEKGGMLGGLGKLAKFADNSKSEYTVNVSVDVDGAKLDPSDSADVKVS